MGNVSSIPKESPLGCTVDKWSDFICEPMTKRKMNNAWSQSLLGAPHLCRIILGPCIPCTVTLSVLCSLPSPVSLIWIQQLSKESYCMGLG